MEIELYDRELEADERHELSCVRLSKFEYDGIQEWASGCLLANYWRFYYPLRNADIMDIQKDGDYLYITPKDQDASDRYYWGVRKITSKRIPLGDITADKVVEQVFYTFNSL